MCLYIVLRDTPTELVHDTEVVLRICMLPLPCVSIQSKARGSPTSWDRNRGLVSLLLSTHHWPGLFKQDQSVYRPRK